MVTIAALSQGIVFVYEQETGQSVERDSPFELKEIMVEVGDTADDGDTFTVDLSLYGMSAMKYIKGWDHTADAMVLAAPTTSVSGTTVTVTIGGATDNLKRTFLIGGY